MRRKILFYSPYSQAMPHALHEITIAKSLQLRGAEIIYICCDSIFDICDANWDRWSTRTQDSCRKCMDVAVSRLAQYGIQYEMLGEYLTNSDKEAVQNWCSQISDNNLRKSSYKGYPVAEYALSSFGSHYRLSSLDLIDPKILSTYRNYIKGCALAVEAFSKLLSVHNPDTLVMFNGRFFSHNLLLDMSRNCNIPVFIHERGWRDNTIKINFNENVLSQNIFREIWKSWKDIPLSEKQIKKIDSYFRQRRIGKNTGWFSYVHDSHEMSKIYEKLLIDPETVIVTLFTSSTDEVIGAKEFEVIIDQEELIDRAITYFSKKENHCLVIRIHPNTVESDVLVATLKKRQGELPSNVKLILPNEAINSYQLLDASSSCIVFMSTIGLEAASIGKPVLVCGRSLIYGQDYSLNLPHAEACESYFERLLSEPSGDIKQMRSAYRYGYHLYFRTCMPFPLVKTTEVFKSCVTYTSPDQLVAGIDPTLDRICNAILENRSVDELPDASRTHSYKDEDYFFADKAAQQPVSVLKKKIQIEPQKILFVCHNIPPYEYSGTPIITQGQAHAMMHLGKEVAVLVPSQEVTDTYKEILDENGLRIFKIPKIDREWAFFEELHNYKSIENHVKLVSEILSLFQPDVIHINDYVDMPISIFKALTDTHAVIVREVWNDEEVCFRVSPILEESHEICSGPDSFQKCYDCYNKKNSYVLPDLQQKLISHWRYIENIYANVVDGVVFASPMFKDHFKRYIQISDEKIAIIPSGLQNAPEKKPDTSLLNKNTITFTFMGNFFEFRKGLDVLLKACTLLGAIPGVRILIFGHGREDSLAEIERVSQLTKGMVAYQGSYSSKDLPSILGATDVGIVTSYFESYCMVLREFLVAGIPVLSTNFFGSEIIEDGVNGYLIELGDAATLMKKIALISSNKILLEALTEGVKDTTIPTIYDEAQNLLFFYSQLLSKKNKWLKESAATLPPHLTASHIQQLPSIAIKCCAPSRMEQGWNDTFIAGALALAFERQGYACRVDCRDQWYSLPETDIVIHLKGLHGYTPNPSSKNIIWIISHPELVTRSEINTFDFVFCASKLFSQELTQLYGKTVHYLPQASDPHIFKPVHQPHKDIDVLFVGNNYKTEDGGCRKIIADLQKSGKDYNLAIVGQNWRGYVQDKNILAEFIPPGQLPALYSRAKIVLNDHHPEMLRRGFVNNRTFDLALSKVFQISDNVEGLEEFSVLTYKSPEDLAQKIDFCLSRPQARELIASQVYEACKTCTFDKRVPEILNIIFTLIKF